MSASDIRKAIAANIVAAVGDRVASSDNAVTISTIVREAIEKTGNKFLFKLNIPKEFGSILMNIGFFVVSGEPQEGDIGVWSETSSHPNGHVQIFADGAWYSDFKQESRSPWSEEESEEAVFSLFRFH